MVTLKKAPIAQSPLTRKEFRVLLSNLAELQGKLARETEAGNSHQLDTAWTHLQAARKALEAHLLTKA